MNKNIILFTSTSADNIEFDNCWKLCVQRNSSCFDEVQVDPDRIFLKKDEYALFVFNGNDYCQNLNWDFEAIKLKCDQVSSLIEDTDNPTHVLVHTDDKNHLIELKKIFDKTIQPHIYSSNFKGIWELIIPFKKREKTEAIVQSLTDLWQYLVDNSDQAEELKPVTSMIALRHNLAKSKRRTFEFSEHCISQMTEKSTLLLHREILTRLEKSRIIFNDCLKQGVLVADDNQKVDQIYEHFEKIENRTKEMKVNHLKITDKIDMGFDCADGFSLILDIINEEWEG